LKDLDRFRGTFAFLVGAAIVVGGLIDECPRVGAIAVGLLMMGVFSVPEAMRFIQGRNGNGNGHTS
jgi:hypothetical protein